MSEKNYSQDLVTTVFHETLKKICIACENGCLNELETILNSIEPNQLDRHFNECGSCIQSDLTPLMTASVKGQEPIVRFLLKKYGNHIRVDQERMHYNGDRFDNFVSEPTKETALCLAVRHKHFDVVRTLVSVGKANVNHRTDLCTWLRKCTPLYWACAGGDLKMVKYLIENGADSYNLDEYKSTTLMIACRFRCQEIVGYLLCLEDVNHTLLNTVDVLGLTALHIAAANGALNIVRLLLEEHQAKIIKSNDGYTPLTMAGISDQIEVVNYFIEKRNDCCYTPSQLIDELELIGSLIVISQRDRFNCDGNFEKQYQYLLWAMEMRYRNPDAPILKGNLATPIEAYEYYVECQTLEELELIKSDSNCIILECLMIHERLLGVTLAFIESLHFYGCRYKSEKQYRRALQIGLYECNLRSKTQLGRNELALRLKSYVHIMYEMVELNRIDEIQFSTFTWIFEATIDEFVRNKNVTFPIHGIMMNVDIDCPYDDSQIGEYNSNDCVDIIFDLLFIATKVSEVETVFGLHLLMLFLYLNQLNSFSLMHCCNQPSLCFLLHFLTGRVIRVLKYSR